MKWLLVTTSPAFKRYTIFYHVIVFGAKIQYHLADYLCQVVALFFSVELGASLKRWHFLLSSGLNGPSPDVDVGVWKRMIELNYNVQ